MSATDAEPVDDDGLDVSDLDRHMGVPMEPGELKEPVAVNDIRLRGSDRRRRRRRSSRGRVY